MKNKIVAQLIEDQPAEALKRVESSYDTVSNELTLYARIDLPNSYAQTQTFQDLKTVDILINRDANGSLVLGTNRLKLNDYVLERISESLLSVNGNLQITGNLVLNGDLNIHGSVNTYNQDILSIGDTWLNLGISVESNIDGGIRIYGAASALLSTLKYQVSDNRWKLDKGLDITGTLTATGYNPANWDTAYGWGNHASAGYYIGTAATIRALLSSSATGLTYTNTTGVFSLTSGYAIPTTAKQTQWDTAYTHSQNSDQAHSDYLKNNANDTTTGTLTAAGLITTGSAIVDGILLQDSIDRSGLLEINRLGSTGWTGIQAKFSATALWSLMGNETNFGLYDDINIKWILLCEKNAAVNLYYNGNVKLGTTNTGVAITGQVVADGTGNNSFMGNLGVGTENPTSAIHVYSATQDKMIAVQSGALGISGIFQSFASGGNLQLRKSDGTLNTVVRSYGDSYFNGGNLGIGTDTPLSKLDVRTSATGIIARFGIDADNRLTIYQNVSGGSRSIYNLVNGAVSTLRIGHNTSDLAINIEGGSRKFWGSYSGVESNGAADGFTGNGWIFDWSVSGNTSLVIDSLTVRKEMRIYSLEINRIRNTNGSLYVSDAGIIKSVTSDATNYTIVLDTEIGNPFQVGDILRCQQWSATDTSLKYYEITVATSVGNTITALVASKVGSGTITANDILNRDGHTTVGNAREGLLYLTSSDTNSPYMAVVKKNTVGGAYTNYVRVGKLDGVTSSNFGALTGMGFWAAGNAYLEGTIYSIAGKIGGNTIDANGIRSANNRVHFDNDNTRIVVTKAATTTPTSGARIQMYYVDDNNWGLYGTPDGTNVMFQLGSTNQIAGWTITSTSINKSNIELNAGTTPYIKAGTLAGYDPNTTNIGFYT
ncbi:MAG: hypothetical protein M0P66_04390, partial [Salinivirgaceae bacterium]|nr:hypothetical protein [Salinivirgaceae bacterium]